MTNCVTPAASICKNEQYFFCLKTKKICIYLTNFKTSFTPLLCRRHEYMVPYVFTVICFFSVLGKITILLFERKKPTIKCC